MTTKGKDVLSNIKDLMEAGFKQNQAEAIVDIVCTIPKDKDDIIENLIKVVLEKTQAEAIANLIRREYKNYKK